MIKPLSKLALAISLLLSNYTPPSNSNYYEDSDDFQQFEVLSHTWGWSLSKANACDEWESYECIEIIGQPSEPWEPFENCLKNGILLIKTHLAAETMITQMVVATTMVQNT